MKKTAVFLLLILMVASQITLADRGSIPFNPHVRIFEPGQNAVIGWNGSEEILVLSTDLHASQKTKVLEVIPLPAEPEVKKAEKDIFHNVNSLLMNLRLREGLKDLEILRDNRSSRGARSAGEVTQHKKIGAHDISVTQVKEADGFVSWVETYLKNNGASEIEIPAPLKEVIEEYLNDGFNWFVFDVVELGRTTGTNTGIQYKFKSDHVYYPLKITRAETGQTKVKLAIFSSQKLNQFNGLSKSSLKSHSADYKIDAAELKNVSSEISQLFDIPSSSKEKKFHLYDWKISGELSSFKNDLLVKEGPAEGKELTFMGTKFINCKSDSNYPFETNKEITTITGVIQEKLGSRMYPWRAATVNNLALFNAQTGKLIRNYEKMLNKKVSINGYPGVAEIKMKNPFDKQLESIKFKDAFYITSIVGWDYVYGDSTNEDGEVVSNNIHFWTPK